MNVGFLGAVSLVLWLVSLAVYRLYLHPLARTGVPGPFLAALTTWYEAYYDVILKGQYIFEIERMHGKYGICFLLFEILKKTFCNYSLFDERNTKDACINSLPGK